MAKDINPNARNPFVDSKGRLSKYGMDIILKLYRALEFTGSGDSIINNIENKGNPFIGYDLSDEYHYINVIGDFTSFTNCFLNVTSQSVITLNQTPMDEEQVIIHKNTNNHNDYVDITDGTGTDRVYYDQAVISYRYSVELKNWIRGI